MKKLQFNKTVYSSANDKTVINCAVLGVAGFAAVPAFLLMTCFDGVQYSCNLLASRVVSRVAAPVAKSLGGKRYTGNALPKDLNFFIFETSDILDLMIKINKAVGFGCMIDSAQIIE